MVILIFISLVLVTLSHLLLAWLNLPDSLQALLVGIIAAGIVMWLMMRSSKIELDMDEANSKALQDKNAQLEAKNASLEADVETLKAQVAALLAR